MPQPGQRKPVAQCQQYYPHQRFPDQQNVKPHICLRQRGRGGYAQEDVVVPDESAHRAPEAFREQVMRALEGGLPEAYRRWNEQYYEELVK